MFPPFAIVVYMYLLYVSFARFATNVYRPAGLVEYARHEHVNAHDSTLTVGIRWKCLTQHANSRGGVIKSNVRWALTPSMAGNSLTVVLNVAAASLFHLPSSLRVLSVFAPYKRLRSPC